MATIHKEITIEASAAEVWAAVRDVGAVHERLVPGLVVATTLDNDVRTVTFANGTVVREQIVTVDDSTRRLVYAATGGRTTHHNASLQVFADGPRRARLVWITDLLPSEAVPPVSALVDQGSSIMKATIERHAPLATPSV
jgi:carbon monoxide dehydrogenase subunit G